MSIEPKCWGRKRKLCVILISRMRYKFVNLGPGEEKNEETQKKGKG